MLKVWGAVLSLCKVKERRP